MPDPTEIARHEEQHSKDNAEKTESPADAKNTADKNAKEARDKAKDVKGQRFENQRLKRKPTYLERESEKLFLSINASKQERLLFNKANKLMEQIYSKYEEQIKNSKNPQEIVNLAIKELENLLNRNQSLQGIRDGFDMNLFQTFEQHVGRISETWFIKIAKKDKIIEVIATSNRIYYSPKQGWDFRTNKPYPSKPKTSK